MLKSIAITPLTVVLTVHLCLFDATVVNAWSGIQSGEVPESGHAGFDQPYSQYSGVDQTSGAYQGVPVQGYAEMPAHGYLAGEAAPEFLSGTPVSPGSIRLETNTTAPLLDFMNRQSDKEILLMLPPNNFACYPELIVGAQFRASGLVAHTNTADKFSYLGRFPTDFSGNSATDFRLLHANQAAIARVTPWATGYVETLFSDVFTFPTFNQGSFQIRQAYVTFGDLSQSPWYAFIGKKTVNFGDMGTLSPFSQSMLWHYFSPLTEGAGVGYAQDGLQFSVTALNGSRGIRVADSEEKGHVNNFAANIRYELPVGDAAILAVGGGYLHGTIYDGSVAEHINPQIFGPRNAAWDVNSSLTAGPWRFEGEIASTLKPWPVTNADVLAWKGEAAYDLTLRNQRPVRFSGSWSEGLQGPAGSEFEFNRQLVLGLRYEPHEQVMMSFEYVRNFGFAPLINITTASERDASQDSFVLGLVLTI
ncbi:MAG: LbtU family siderophore porin [Planctomyces sp.]|nr:LbtU family siderophore porin [Planctomyces sp.]